MSPVPHAYVVDYRPIDACAPPLCRIDGRRASGRVDADPPGGYVAIGNDTEELFARRGVVLASGEALSFTLPRLARGAAFDASFAAAGDGGGPVRATLEVSSRGRRVFADAFSGVTARYAAPASAAQVAREERYFLHVRRALPEVDGAAEIVLRNTGPGPLGVGAPLVLRRDEGRRPRQVVLVFFDAVPYAVLDRLYRGEERAGGWLSGWVAGGALLRDAVSPGQLTGSFVRRFFRADFYRLAGEPSLFGQGFGDEPPPQAEGPVARLAEQGFFTEALASNLYLSPYLSRIGFDADYNVESTLDLPPHPEALARSFARELAAHAEDDALFVVWFANTHAPWREGRAGAPPFRDDFGAPGGVDLEVLDPIWRNLLDGVAALRAMVEGARATAPADRLWVVGTDHGHTFTRAARARPWRLAREVQEGGHMHCCLSTSEEARTEVALVGEEGARLADSRGAREEGGAGAPPSSTMAVWGEIERRLGVDLGLPATSAFAPAGRDAPFEDGLVVSVGDSGALYARRGAASYRSYEPSPKLAPAWTLSPAAARLLLGSPAPSGDVPAEELYDLARDPLETENLAASRPEELVAMRRRLADWLAEYGDGLAGARYEYRLDFGRPVELSVRAPRRFRLGSELEPDEERGPSAVVRGALVRLSDGAASLGVLDVAVLGDPPPGRGGLAERERGLVVRCRWSRLPLAVLSAEHPRLNLALARTNCADDGAAPAEVLAGAAPAPGEALFEARQIGRAAPPTAVAVGAHELKRALTRWGYVRDR